MTEMIITILTYLMYILGTILVTYFIKKEIEDDDTFFLGLNIALFFMIQSQWLIYCISEELSITVQIGG